MTNWVTKVDLKKFKMKFANQIELFKNVFQTDGLIFFNTKQPIVTKNGAFYMLRGPKRAEGGSISFVATRKAPLTAFEEFLKAIGKISNNRIERVFSPEERLFDPYFVFLSDALTSVIKDERVLPQFKQAFDYYESKDYQHCVSTLGLIAEDYLTQVYETYLRAPSPKGLTLGQIYDQFQTQVKTLLNLPKESLVSLDNFYQKISNLKNNSPDKIDEYLSLFRDFVHTIKADRRFYDEKFGEITRRDVRIPIFPNHLRENINELIRNRNAAAHRTRVPIGNFEAVRTLFCLVSLVTWWLNEKDRIDWEQDMATILREAIARNS